jgi:hypothetical protein
LEKHLKVCNGNKLLQIQKEEFFIENLNQLEEKQLIETQSIDFYLKKHSEETFKLFVKKIENFYDKFNEEMEMMIFKE